MRPGERSPRLRRALSAVTEPVQSSATHSPQPLQPLHRQPERCSARQPPRLSVQVAHGQSCRGAARGTGLDGARRGVQLPSLHIRGRRAPPGPCKPGQGQGRPRCVPRACTQQSQPGKGGRREEGSQPPPTSPQPLQVQQQGPGPTFHTSLRCPLSRHPGLLPSPPGKALTVWPTRTSLAPAPEEPSLGSLVVRPPWVSLSASQRSPPPESIRSSSACFLTLCLLGGACCGQRTRRTGQLPAGICRGAPLPSTGHPTSSVTGLRPGLSREGSLHTIRLGPRQRDSGRGGGDWKGTLLPQKGSARGPSNCHTLQGRAEGCGDPGSAGLHRTLPSLLKAVSPLQFLC